MIDTQMVFVGIAVIFIVSMLVLAFLLIRLQHENEELREELEEVRRAWFGEKRKRQWREKQESIEDGDYE